MFITTLQNFLYCHKSLGRGPYNVVKITNTTWAVQDTKVAMPVSYKYYVKKSRRFAFMAGGICNKIC